VQNHWNICTRFAATWLLWAFLALSIASDGLLSVPAFICFVLGAAALYAMLRILDEDSAQEGGDTATNIVAACVVTVLFGILPGVFIPMPWLIAMAVLYFIAAAVLLGSGIYGLAKRKKTAET
jgi:hypothetical protein